MNDLPDINEIEEQKLVPKVESETTEEETPKTTEDSEATTEETPKEETTEEKPQEEETPAEEKPVEETPAENKDVPASFQKRVNELVYQSKSKDETIANLEKAIHEFKNSGPPSEAKEKEVKARDYLKSLIGEVLQSQKSEDDVESEALEEEIKNTAAVFKDFDRDKVLEVMEKYNIPSVDKAYEAWKKMDRVIEDTKEDTRKKIIAKPKNPSSSKSTDGLSDVFSKDNMKDKELHELADMAINEAGH